MKQTKHLYSFFSNHLDILSHLLNNYLFNPQSRPFDRRWIIVPNKSVGYWLKNKLTIFNQSFLSMGVSIIGLDEFFKEIFQLSSNKNFSKKLLLEDALVPYIYKELINDIVLEQNYSFNKQIGNFHKDSLPYSIIFPLMSLFKKYYFYHVVETKNLSWQLNLWNKIKKYFYSIEEVFSIAFNILAKQQFEFSLSFFCLDHFSVPLLSFIDTISDISNTFIYHLSPCSEFWGDVISDQQISYLQTKFKKFNINKKEQKDWANLVANRHPLLANLGQLGKKSFNRIQDLDPIFIDEYFLPGNNSNLSRIQTDLLYLSPSSEILSDNSISVHVSNNQRREVEVVFNNITSLIAKENPSLNDIFIAAPDISLYESYLKTIFHRLPVTILGKRNSFASSLLEKIQLIQQLLKNELCFNSVSSLFSYKDFRNKMNLDEEDISYINSWLKTHPFFQNKEKDSWQLSLNSLMNDYPDFNYKNNNDSYELIGKISLWINYIQEIPDRIKILSSQTLLEWFYIFSSYLNDLFSLQAEEKFILTSLEKLFFDLTHLEEISSITFPCNFFLDFFTEKIKSKQKDLKHSFIKNTVHCGNLKELSIIPKKFFFILGMNLNSAKPFPYTDEKGSSRFPSDLEIENQVLLNALITTGNMLTISYVTDSHTQAPPTFSIDEIKKFIHKNNIFYHPNKNYSPKYFSQEYPYLKLNTIHRDLSYLYKLSSAHAIQHNQGTNFFTQHDSFKKTEIQKKQITLPLNIRQLSFALSHPLHHFISGKFRNFITKKPDVYSKPKFFITEKEKQILLNKMLEPSFDLNTKNKDLFLSPEFLKIVEEEKNTVSGLFKTQINHAELMHIVFSNNYQTPLIKENIIYLPPLQINVQEKQLVITGTINGILHNSLLVLDKKSISSLIKILPSLALLKMKEYLKEIPRIKEIRFFSDYITTEECDKNYLLDIVKHFLLSQQKPSPLLVEWLPHILNFDEKKLEESINLTIQKNSYGILHSAFFAYREPPNALSILEHWGDQAKKLFPMWNTMR